MKKMRKAAFLFLFLAAVLVISSLGVFAADEFGTTEETVLNTETGYDTDGEFGTDDNAAGEESAVQAEPAAAVSPGEWRDDRKQYLHDDGTPYTGLFVALKVVGTEGLYYADSDGNVRNTVGPVDVPKGNTYLLNSKGRWVADGSAHTYYVTSKSDPYLADEAGVYGSSTKYYVSSKGVVKKDKGTVKDPDTGDRYYVQTGGKIKTSEGFVKVDSETKVFVQEGGKIRLKKGKFGYNGNYYVIIGSYGHIVITKRFVNTDDGKVYVASTSGVLARNRTLTIKSGGKTKSYHINSKAWIQTNMHKWKGDTCIADKNGVLKTKGICTYNNKKYYVNNSYGRIAIGQRFKYNGRWYFASKKDGHLLSGIISWYDGKYYYCDSKCRQVASAGIYRVDGKNYYVTKNGNLAVNSKITTNYKHYYAGSKAAFLTSSFRFNNVWVDPNHSTGEISFKDWNAMHNYKWKYYQYIQVNLSRQQLVYFYNGVEMVSCKIVSGRDGFSTPKVNATVLRKYYNQTGKMNGKDIRFDYWMQFGNDKTNAIGDGPYWMTTYGGTYYRQNGSDGEILIPLSAARTLFNNAPVNTPVIIH
jgi:glucan-binding YG repeat protein